MMDNSGHWKCPECGSLWDVATNLCVECEKEFVKELYELTWEEFWAECNELKNGC
jgi:DNA-directed RNA polymerase subunit RPC12/RpoP